MSKKKTRVFTEYEKCPRCGWCANCRKVSDNVYTCTARNGEDYGSKFSEYMLSHPKASCSGFNPE